LLLQELVDRQFNFACRHYLLPLPPLRGNRMLLSRLLSRQTRPMGRAPNSRSIQARPFAAPLSSRESLNHRDNHRRLLRNVTSRAPARATTSSRIRLRAPFREVNSRAVDPA
jgi:hypothetical protein